MADDRPLVVTDASIVAAWSFPDEIDEYAEEILESIQTRCQPIAPILWVYEIRNVLLGAVRKQRVTRARVDELFGFLAELNVSLYAPDSPTNLFQLAERHSLTYYDAAYLDLAIREGASLATLDKALRRAAGDAGVALYGL